MNSIKLIYIHRFFQDISNYFYSIIPTRNMVIESTLSEVAKDAVENVVTSSNICIVN